MDTNQPVPVVVKTELSDKFSSAIFVLLSIALVGYLSLFSGLSVASNPLLLGFFALFTCAAVIQLLDSFSTAVAENDILKSRSLIHRTLSVHMSEISRVRNRPARQKLELLDASGVTRARITESVPTFARFFDFLRERRPDLWPLTNETRFRKRWMILLILIAPSLLFAGLVAFSAVTRTLTLQVAGLASFGILLMVVMLKNQPIGFEIAPDCLFIQFPFRLVRLTFSEIQRIELALPGEQNATSYTLAIHTGAKRGYALNGFEINEVFIYDKLSALLPGKASRANRAA